MSQKKPYVILTRRLPDSIETRMRELFDAKLNETDEALSQEALVEVVQTADVLVPTVTDRIDAELIAKAGNRLKLIASFGTGVDHIDLSAARQRGITVTNTPGVLTEDTADVAMALMLAVPRRIAEGDKRARSGNWQGWSPTAMLGHRINGKRLGIIGMGRLVRRLLAVPVDLVFPFIITTARLSIQRPRLNWRQPIGNRLNRCSHVLILSPSTVRTHWQPISFCLVSGWR